MTDIDDIGAIDYHVVAQRDCCRDQSQYESAPQYEPPPQYQTPPPAPVADPSDQLERLGALKAEGILTDAEFQAQKQKTLAG